ncbi:sensor histidine kinase [Actinoplanes sp. LDG1-01]|uniref:histidine kinase n=1 Tax=Paractinoplanes lichenicola TaxID=2802976 RepID=A0ABS1VHC0_9ACTN|nr:sensor histidine kinase [Actinoplanes lichenicola]
MTLGALSGAAEGLFLIVAGLVWVSPGRAVVAGHAREIAAWERRRLSLPPVHTPDERRVVAYLAARLWPAFLGTITVSLFLTGLVLVVIVVRAFATGQMGVLDLLGQALIGSALLALNIQAVGSVLRLDRWLAHRLLETGSRDALEQRITELTATRAGVMAAVDAERRRIERDLHDGLQQRLVALGMLLGRARRSRDADQAATLLAQAHDDAQRALDELREVAWRVYPSALDHGTLDDALTMVAQRSAVPVRIAYRLDERPPPQVETVLYFVACEAITNAAKHSGATVIDIEIDASATEFEMHIRDDGQGGADPTGSGLQGLSRRVAALDGHFTLHSPTGGGTTIQVTLPQAPTTPPPSHPAPHPPPAAAPQPAATSRPTPYPTTPPQPTPAAGPVPHTIPATPLPPAATPGPAIQSQPPAPTQPAAASPTATTPGPAAHTRPTQATPGLSPGGEG